MDLHNIDVFCDTKREAEKKFRSMQNFMQMSAHLVYVSDLVKR